MKLLRLFLLGCAFFASATAVRAQVVLNEIQADNQKTVANKAGHFSDWVEIYNAGSSSKNLGGFSLSDDRLKPGKFVFPTDTILAPGGFLLVWCDNDLTAPGLHTDFTLNADGHSIWLFNLSGVVIDSLNFGLQLPDHSIGRVPDGNGVWQLNLPTPRAPNQPEALGTTSTLKINEWMAVDLPNSDWFEIYNPADSPVALGGLILSDRTSNPTNRPIPALSFIEARGFQKFVADDSANKGANHVDFKLSSSNGDNITIYSANRSVINRVTFGPQQQGISQGRLPDGSSTLVFFPTTSTPGESNYLPLPNAVINEVLTHTDPPLEDAIELYNSTDQPANIGGWYLSNDKKDLKKFRIPDGTIIPPAGFKVFYEYQFDPNDQGFTFNSAHGDDAYISQVDATGKLTGYRNHENLVASENGVSLGRYVKSTGKDFVPMSGLTFGVDNPSSLAAFRQGTGEPNSGPKIGPLVINEIMYHPRDTFVGTNGTDNTLDEFLEIYNITGQAVPLYDPNAVTNTWHIRGGIDFDFPLGERVPARSFILLLNFDPATNATTLNNFRARFGVPAGTKFFGPYGGKLNNGGDTIELLKPDPPQEPPHPDAGFVPYILVERVKYDRAAPWPTTADGTGASLQRKNPREYGNDPINWFAGPPTAGTANSPGIELLISGPTFNASGFAFGFTAEAGKTYGVQYRESLIAGSWLPLTNIVAQSTSHPVQIADPAAGGSMTRFYRVISPSP